MSQPWDTDDGFLAALQDGTLPIAEFGHKGHIRLGHLLLRRYSFAEALNQTRETIRGYATAKGGADKYHETITVFYLYLIAEGLEKDGSESTFSAFLDRHPHLRTREIEKDYFPDGIPENGLAKEGIVFHRVRP